VSVHDRRDELPQVADISLVWSFDEVVSYNLINFGQRPGWSELRREVADQRKDVLGAIAERGERDRHAGNAVIEIAPELPPLNLVGETPIRRADQAEARLLPRVASQSFERALLNGTQQLGLQP
jgi:hypothetical protein